MRQGVPCGLPEVQADVSRRVLIRRSGLPVIRTSLLLVDGML